MSHPSHETRYSDSSLYDEVCVRCGARDYMFQRHTALDDPCPAPRTVSILQTPPPGHHYDPYSRTFKPNLTEAEVQALWPYNKETPKPMEPIHDWLDDAMPTIPKKEHSAEDAFQHPCTIEVPQMVRDGELTSAPTRLLGPADSASARAPQGTKEEHEALAQFLNVAAAAEAMQASDMVVMPQHYARFKIEPIRFICENNLNFFQANIVKYILRWDAKNGLEDLNKAKRYLEMFIKFVEGNEDWWRKPK